MMWLTRQHTVFYDTEEPYRMPGETVSMFRRRQHRLYAPDIDDWYRAEAALNLAAGDILAPLR